MSKCDCPGAGHDPSACASTETRCRVRVTQGRICGRDLPCPDHVRRTEWTVPDERDLRELTNRRGAICVRNAILALVPPDLVEDAMATADQTLEALLAEQDPTPSTATSWPKLSGCRTRPERLRIYRNPLTQRWRT